MSNIFSETMEMAAINFVEWVYKNKYVKYWGSNDLNCDKWYLQYSPPNRTYYSTKELYDLFAQSERERIEAGLRNEKNKI